MHPILSVEQVSKTFQRGGETITALAHISFDIRQATILALAGPSGSGKTSLLNALARFDRVDTGSIKIDGTDITGLQDKELDNFRNRKLGFVFQQFNLLKVLSAVENVELSLLPQQLSSDERRRRALSMLDAVGLSTRANHRPEQLSGGQQQRVALARALVGVPQLVIADEPTGNLDSHTTQEILQLISELNRDLQTTFVIATHDQRVMAAADKVIHLADGRMLS